MVSRILLVIISIFCAAFNLIIGQSVNEDLLKQQVVKIRSELETGTGTIVAQKDSSLYILTAWHVVRKSNEVKVQFFNSFEEYGLVINNHEEYDVALIKCKQPKGSFDVKVVSFSGKKIYDNQEVLLISNPLDKSWVVDRNLKVRQIEYDFDEDRFTIEPKGVFNGSSGGPVFNGDNEMVGMILEVDPTEGICRKTILPQKGKILKLLDSWGIFSIRDGPRISREPGNDFDFLVYKGDEAFKKQNWVEAKHNYQLALSMKNYNEISDKIKRCDLEIDRDRHYAKNLEKGLKNQNNSIKAFKLFQKAQFYRNTKEIKELIKSTIQKIDHNDNWVYKSEKSYLDPIAGEMVFVEGGSFLMGSDHGEDDEKPIHEVFLSDFYVGRYEVKNIEFASFLIDTLRIAKQAGLSYDKRKLVERNLEHVLKVLFYKESIFEDWFKWSYGGLSGYALTVNVPKNFKTLPVRYVSWRGAMLFCKWLRKKTGKKYSLPTEAQWEYAARGGRKNIGYEFAGADSIAEVAWYKRNSGERVHNPGEKRPNQLGLYDMNGNVLEWCSDYYDKDFYYSCIGTLNPFKKERTPYSKVIRGGCIIDEGIKNFKVSARLNPKKLGIRYVPYLGFRVAREID